MKYQVPQFIEIEDKIFGPLTFKQFVYVAGSLGLSFLIWKSLPAFFAVLVVIPVAGLGFSLAFYKINNRPLIGAIENAIKYSLSSRLYLWKKEQKKIAKKMDDDEVEETNYVPKLSDSKLKDIAWSLDIHDSLYSNITPGEKVNNNPGQVKNSGKL